MRKQLFFAGLLLAVLPLARLGAQDETPHLPAGKKGMPIVFLPPPMEGTLSLGVYSKEGRLIRTLRTEANAEKDFTVGLNGLITAWDGNDDAGRPAPSGNYSVRGFAVGALEVTGEAFHGNDWITEEDSPHVQQITSLKALDAGRLQVLVKLRDGSAATLQGDADGKVTAGADNDPDKSSSGTGVEDLKAQLSGLPGLEKPLDAALGKGETIWVIDERTGGAIEVKQYALGGKELIRRLAIDAAEPPPRQISAARDDERIYLLEGNAGNQRVRGLRLEGTEPAAAGGGETVRSTWKTFFARQITEDDASVSTPAAASARITWTKLPTYLKRPDFKVEEKLRIKLVPNPLLKESSGVAELEMGWDVKGSYLKTADGLVLARLTDTPGLHWAILGKEGKNKSHVLFQSDGTVVEEYKLKQLANMMAFDAGDYEWKRP